MNVQIYIRKIKNDKNLIVINKKKWQKFCFNAVNIGEKYFPQEGFSSNL